MYVSLKNDLENIIDKENDSLRFYVLGDHYKSKITHIGIKQAYDAEETLII